MYKEALRQLKRTYDNPTATRDAVVRKFCARTPLAKSTGENSRSFLSAFNAATNTLRLLKLPDRSHEARILAALLHQSPTELKFILKRLKEKSWSKIRRALDDELKCLETSRIAFDTSPVQSAGPAPRPCVRVLFWRSPISRLSDLFILRDSNRPIEEFAAVWTMYAAGSRD